MKIRSVSLKKTHVPDITFYDFDGNECRNAELPESDQIRVDLRVASGSELVEYQKGYTVVSDKTQKHYSSINIELIVAKHVSAIHGLDHETGLIDTANKLISGAKNDDILGTILLDCFNVIMGYKNPKENEPKEDLAGE
jgi:hypothetical protein